MSKVIPSDEHKQLMAKWRKWFCPKCGRRLDEAEALLYSIFTEQCKEGAPCIDCERIAHQKRHPGRTCCQARLGHDEGCLNADEVCYDYYETKGCSRCGRYGDE